MIAALHEIVVAFLAAEGDPALIWIAAARVAAGGGGDADDGEGRAGELNGFADDGWVGVEAVFPKFFGDDHEGGRGRGVVSRFEKTAGERFGLEREKKIARDLDDADLKWFAVAGEGHADPIMNGEAFEGFCLGFPILEIWIGDGAEPGGAAFGEVNEAIGIGEWERAEEYGIDDGENGGGGADAEAECEDGDCGESDVAAKLADGEF